MKTHGLLGSMTLALLVACGAGAGGGGPIDQSGDPRPKTGGGGVAYSGGAWGDAAAAPVASGACTSGRTWTSGNQGSPSMHPGHACLTCHSQNSGPVFAIAGTVYPTSHEPDDCDGAALVQVVVTDANGATATATTNDAGNFHIATLLTPPFQVKLVNGSKERAMAVHTPSGDCNSCHTESGASGAPGRLLAP